MMIYQMEEYDFFDLIGILKSKYVFITKRNFNTKQLKKKI